MPRIIEVIVSPTGETTIHTKGFVGGDCLEASKFLESAFVGTIANNIQRRFLVRPGNVCKRKQ